jgi:hypothetical protein
MQCLCRWALALLLSIAAQAQAQPAEANPACAARSVDAKGQAQVHNRCDQPVALYYCNAARPISKKRCGEQTVPGTVYYTHHRVVDPGKTSVFSHPAGEIRIAACMGQARPQQPHGFQSQADGSFTCPPVDKRQLSRASALGPSRAAACESARKVFDGGSSSHLPCECRVHKRSDGREVHHCHALGRLKDEGIRDGLIDDLKDWVRKGVECQPSEDAQQCRRRGHQFVGPTGTRG